MKKEYEQPEIRIVKLTFDDIITQSGDEQHIPTDQQDKNWTPFEPY